jgi:hypothetical protein
MAQKSWIIELEDGVHTVELNHGYFTGKRSIRVDDEAIILHPDEKQKLFDTGSTHSFKVSGHTCKIAIYSFGLNFRYELIVDNVDIETGLPVPDEETLHLSPESIGERRTTLVIFFSLCGLALIWINWRMAHSGGYYHPFIAMMGPAVMVIAGYYLLTKEDPWEFSKASPFRLIWVLVLALLLGIANWYATEHGLY